MKQNKTYKVQHVVQNLGNGTLINKHIFKTNIIPHSGKCEGDKTELQAVSGSLNVSCQNWINEDGILAGYEAWSLNPNGLPKLIYFGNDSTFSLTLPLGDSEKNFALQVEVKVFDEYESTSVVLDLNVSMIK